MLKKTGGMTAHIPHTIMKNKLFNKNSPLYPLRWYITGASVLLLMMIYADITGWRFFGGGSGQTWSRSQGIYHK